MSEATQEKEEGKHIAEKEIGAVGATGEKPDGPESGDDVIVENETEEGGYKSDRSASDEGSTDAVVERRREKGSSGYEESGEEEEGVSEISEGRREKFEEEEDEYDEEATGEASSGDDISEDIDEEGSEGYEEDTEGLESKGDEHLDQNEEEEQLDDEVEDVKSPSFVPRRTGFWDHDDRYDNLPIEESKFSRGGKSRQLWDKSSGRWEHDMYKEEEQGPKEQWEIEESLKTLEQQSRGRNRRRLGDFIGNRGSGRSHGRRRRDDYEDRRSAEKQEDSSELEERNDERQRDMPRRGRGRVPYHRGSRGRGDFGRGRNRDDNFKKRADNFEKREEQVDDSKREKVFNWEEETNVDGNLAEEESREQEEEVNESRKNREEKPKRDKNVERGGQQSKNVPHKSKQRHQNENLDEPHGSKGRGKGVMSQKMTSAKKTATEFTKERKKHPDREEVNEDKFEDAPDDRKAEFGDAKRSQTAAAKPKRYSSQRQRANAQDEGQFQNQIGEPSIQEEGYAKMTSQDFQDMTPNQTAMAILQYQMQQMQMQMQALQSQRFEGPQAVSLQQQQPVSQGQGTPMLTPAMQQFLQQQFLLQSLQQNQLQQQQHQQEQQQQQMQQQQQQLQQQQQQQMQQQQQQQQMQQQQQHMQELRMRQQIPAEKQTGSPDRGMVVQGNSFPTVQGNLQQFGVVTQPPPGLFQPTATRYEVPYDQMVSRRPPPQQQPGLFIPSMHQITPQQMQMQEQQRKVRSAAIPIKPPPEQEM